MKNPHYIVRFGCVIEDDKYDNHLEAASTTSTITFTETTTPENSVEEQPITPSTTLEHRNKQYQKLLESFDAAPGCQLFAVSGTVRYVVEVGNVIPIVRVDERCVPVVFRRLLDIVVCAH